ncbi:MAG: NAD(P)-binding domain-containing protein, partial [Bacillota bacterium]
HYVGAEVALSYRRAVLDKESIKYWLYPEFSSLRKTGKIQGYFGTVVTRITPSEVVLAPCMIGDGIKVEGREAFTVPADFVLLMVGYLADMSLCRMAGVEMRGTNEVPVYNEQTMETNVPGVFIAGTAIGGTQSKYRVFLENCHIHVDRIVAAITGEPAPPMPELPARPET